MKLLFEVIGMLALLVGVATIVLMIFEATQPS
jgi:uncharacterized membrane protein YbaN (DUF454 family)